MSAWWLAPLGLALVSAGALTAVVGRLHRQAEALSRATVAVRSVQARPRPARRP
jgi:hypothetical protein